MTDLEICMKIAEIEGYKTSVTDVKKGVWASIHKNDCYDWYNPLTDDALCFYLMVAYEVEVDFTCQEACIYYCPEYDDMNPVRVPFACIAGVNKAICLAIIEASK